MSIDKKKQEVSLDRGALFVLRSDRKDRVENDRLARLKAACLAEAGLDVIDFSIADELGSLSMARSLVNALGGAQTEAKMVASLLGTVLKKTIDLPRIKLVVAFDRVSAIVGRQWIKARIINVPMLGWSEGIADELKGYSDIVDRLVVIDEEQKNNAKKNDFDEEDLFIAGLTAGSRFDAVLTQDKAELKKRYQLNPKGAIVLIATRGIEDLTTLLFSLSMVKTPVHYLFDVKDDEAGASLLRKRAKSFGLHAQIFGKTDKVADLWACADYIVGKPSKRVQRRALALNRPLGVLVEDDDELRIAQAFSTREKGDVIAKSMMIANTIDERLGVAILPIDLPAMTLNLHETVDFIANTIEHADLVKDQHLNRTENVGDAQAENDNPLETIGVVNESLENDHIEVQRVDEQIANEKVSKYQKEVKRWEGRLELAQQKNDNSLIQAAQKELDAARGAMHEALAELARIDRKKHIRVSTDDENSAKKTTEQLKAELKKIEVESALDALKKRIFFD